MYLRYILNFKIIRPFFKFFKSIRQICIFL